MGRLSPKILLNRIGQSWKELNFGRMDELVLRIILSIIHNMKNTP